MTTPRASTALIVVVSAAAVLICIATDAIWLLAASASASMVVVAAKQWYTRTGRFLEPGWLIAAVLLVYYHFRAIVLVISPSAPKHDIGGAPYLLSNINFVSILATAAVCSVLLGFSLAWKRVSATTIQTEPFLPSATVLTLMYLVSVVARGLISKALGYLEQT